MTTVAQINTGYWVTNPDPTITLATDPRPDGNFDILGTELVINDPATGYGQQRFLWLKNTAATSTAVGDLMYYDTANIYGLNVCRVIGTGAAQGPRTQYAAVAVSIVVAGGYGWFQTDGYCATVQVVTDTYINGMTLQASATNNCAEKAGAAGTAPTYPAVGRALGAQSGSNPYYVAAWLFRGKF